MIMYNRTIINKLRVWAHEKDRKPLVLRGARQVGKTTVVEIFAQEFDQYIYLNLEKEEEKDLFNERFTFSQLLDAIFFLKNAEKNKGKTLLFIDEIQNAPNAVSKLRFFYEEAKHIHVIAAGSLLESLIDKSISFPVGRVDFLPVRPCSFEEYLEAISEVKSLEIVRSTSIPEFAHNKLSDLFWQYTIIGGMPEIVNDYVENRDFNRLKNIYERLIISYQDDVEKYARNPSQANLIRHIIGASFQYAGTRIIFRNFGGSDYPSREMSEAFKTLEKTMLLQLVYPTTTLKLPVTEKLKRSPKLLLLDTGLVNHLAKLQGELITSRIIDEVYHGKIAEHITGQELMAMAPSVRSKLHFWTREERNAQAEIDYVIPWQDMLIPVEVKSGATGSLRSLHQFINKAPHSIAIRVFSGKYKVEDAKTIQGKKFKLINLPFYLVGQIEKILANEVN